MAPHTHPGPTCNSRQDQQLNDGTTCRQISPRPGPLGAFQLTDEDIARILGPAATILSQPQSGANTWSIEWSASDLPEYAWFVERVLPNLRRARMVDAFFKGSRKGTAIDEVVIHSTDSGQPVFQNTVDYLAHPGDGRDVSIHYLIGREPGELVAMVPEDMRANQAVGHNERSIGIELWKMETDRRDYTNWQYETVAQVVYDILLRRKIPRRHVIGHGEIEPRKKGEPHGFDWPRFDDRLDSLNDQAEEFDPRFKAF